MAFAVETRQAEDEIGGQGEGTEIHHLNLGTQNLPGHRQAHQQEINYFLPLQAAFGAEKHQRGQQDHEHPAIVTAHQGGGDPAGEAIADGAESSRRAGQAQLADPEPGEHPAGQNHYDKRPADRPFDGHDEIQERGGKKQGARQKTQVGDAAKAVWVPERIALAGPGRLDSQLTGLQSLGYHVVAGEHRPAVKHEIPEVNDQGQQQEPGQGQLQPPGPLQPAGAGRFTCRRVLEQFFLRFSLSCRAHSARLALGQEPICSLSCFMSVSTISRTRSSKLRLYSQPSNSLARVQSPTSSSTSAGR